MAKSDLNGRGNSLASLSDSYGVLAVDGQVTTDGVGSAGCRYLYTYVKQAFAFSKGASLGYLREPSIGIGLENLSGGHCGEEAPDEGGGLPAG